MKRGPDLRDVEARLLQVIDRIASATFQRNSLELARHLVRHGEPGVALEELCGYLDEDGVAISADIQAELEALAAQMGMPSPSSPS